MEFFFRLPFAQDGDRVQPALSTQPDGTVSYQEGFTFDYTRDLDAAPADPDAKAVPREVTNGLLYALSVGLKELQQQGVPDWIEPALNGGAPFSYDAYALCRYDDGGGYKVYRSLFDGNTATPTDATKWAILDDLVFASQAQAEAGTASDVAMSPLRTAQYVTARQASQAIAEAGINALALMSPLRTAQAIAAQTPPVGTVIGGLWTAAPSGFLLLNGQTVSRTTYSRLWSASGTWLGPGDGVTTFTLPDWRGRALMGADASAGIDATLTLGATVENRVGLHGHPFYHGITPQASTVAGPTGGIVTTTTGSYATEAAFTGSPSGTQGEQIGGGGDSRNRPDAGVVTWAIKY